MSKILMSIFILFSVLSHAEILTAAMTDELKPLNRACLPVEARMLKNQSASCHYPPAAMGPLWLKAWQAAEILPPNIAREDIFNYIEMFYTIIIHFLKF